ncbi:hypothetical protein L6R52_33015 [Myxococcota bacterium]|nr:hypothetical protein [Myxococcota bacterium]
MTEPEGYKPEPLLVPWTAPPKSAAGRWFQHGHRLDEPAHHAHGHPWWQVLWLTGVDYFSTLGYQPGIALLAAGVLSPLATVFLVLLTLFGALPIYAMVAARSFAGQGSIAMLEDLLTGWRSKVLVLVLLGFAATDFIITITLSAADAAEHMIHNPYLEPYLHGQQVAVTLGLVTLLAAVFLRGFREAIGVALVVAVPYIVLNLVVLGRAFVEIAHHPEALSNWQRAITMKGDWTGIVIACALVFPKLALGMSGFETGVAVMPQVKGHTSDGQGYPRGRIQATRKLLASAAVLMSFMLLASSFATAVLVPESAYRQGGKAAGRAIAWLAHGMLGPTFGTVYDASTILILWFAGASALAGLLNLIPRYLPRFGMAPHWIAFQRPLVLVLYAIAVTVTLIFEADVEAQGGAYATGVLVLMTSGAVAVSIDTWREMRAARTPDVKIRRLALSSYFWVVSAVFVYTLVDNVIERSDGVVIASFFIMAIMAVGVLSRAWRSIELRVSDLTFTDQRSAELWAAMAGRKCYVAPLRTGSTSARQQKAAEIRRFYKVKAPLAFLHVNLVDNRSDFLSPLSVTVTEEDGNYVVEVFGAVAIANTIAYISELIDPIGIFLGLTRQNLMSQSVKYLMWGEGETGLMVYMILLRYWRFTKERREDHPNIFLMSTAT